MLNSIKTKYMESNFYVKYVESNFSVWNQNFMLNSIRLQGTESEFHILHYLTVKYIESKFQGNITRT